MSLLAAAGAAAGAVGAPTDVASLVSRAVSTNPMLTQVAAAIPAIKQLGTELPQVQDKLTAAVKDTVKQEVGKELIQAGLPTSPGAAAAVLAKNSDIKLGTSGATDSKPKVDTSDSSPPNNSGNGGNSNNSDANNSGNGGNNNNGGNSNNSDNNSQEGGGPRYEIVTLSSPIYDPLYVCYKSGHPVYFTRSAKGIQILPNHKDIDSRFLPKEKCTQAILKRAVSKKKQAKRRAPKKKTLRST